MKLMHECRGETVELRLHKIKTPRRGRIADFNRSGPDLNRSLPVPYYDNYVCPNCDIHVMREMPENYADV